MILETKRLFLREMNMDDYDTLYIAKYLFPQTNGVRPNKKADYR